MRCSIDQQSTAAVRVSSILICALIDAVQQCGVSAEQLLSPTSKPIALTVDRDFSLGEFQALFARGVTLTGRPGLGLLAGMNAREHSFDIAFGMPEAARKLGLSVRSLRRRLDDEGASFRELVDDARRDAAHWMLRDPAVTIQAASHDLGFASPSVFHRAFKRWTGMTPAHYRAQQARATPLSAAGKAAQHSREKCAPKRDQEPGQQVSVRTD